MARLQCPRCGALVDERPGSTPVCPGCGFRGEAPASGGGHEPPPASPPSVVPYGSAPGGYETTRAYGAPPGGPVAAPGTRMDRPTNGMAVAALVLSLVGICTGGFTGLLGIIFGFIGRSQCRQRNEKGEGMAVAGIVIGFVVIGLGLLWLLFFFMVPFWL